jgi:hypothetical protein
VWGLDNRIILEYYIEVVRKQTQKPMGRTYRRDDHHSWGKYNKDRRQKNTSERYSRTEEFGEYASRKKNKKKFDLTSTEYYEEDWG